MKNKFNKHFDFIILDTLCLIVSFFLSNLIIFNNVSFSERPINYLIVIIIMVIINLTAIFVIDPFRGVLKRPFYEEVTASIMLLLINVILIVFILFCIKSSALFSRKVLIITYLIFFILDVLTRIIWKRLIQKNIVSIKMIEKKMIVVCGENYKEIVFNIENSEYHKYTIDSICIVGSSKRKITDYKICRKSDLYNYAISNNIDCIFVAIRSEEIDKSIIKKITENGIEINYSINDLFENDFENKSLDNIGIYNTIKLSSYSLSNSQELYLLIKRLIDIMFSILGILLFILLALIIKITYLINGDKNKIIYTHKRVGKDGKEFLLYKFRTMVPNADEKLMELLKDKNIKKEWDANHKLEKDPRITKAGNFLRKTSLDEIPQFINVLKGDMSIIGPRPLVPGELLSKNGLKLYEKVKPGLTGWWACNGRSIISYEERLELEYYYVRNFSLYLDFLCIIRTIYVVLTKKGAR